MKNKHALSHYIKKCIHKEDKEKERYCTQKRDTAEQVILVLWSFHNMQRWLYILRTVNFSEWWTYFVKSSGQREIYRNCLLKIAPLSNPCLFLNGTNLLKNFRTVQLWFFYKGNSLGGGCILFSLFKGIDHICTV